jgi:hypothetical protein
MAMDYLMHIPLKVYNATSNFMIAVTAGAGALVFLARGDVSSVIAAPVAIRSPTRFGRVETRRLTRLWCPGPCPGDSADESDDLFDQRGG